MIKEDIQVIAKDITVDYLKNHPIAIQLEAGIKSYEKVQETLLNLAQAEGEADLMRVRVGTALTWEVLSLVAQGKNPKEFSREDWIQIASKTADNSINIDGQEYSKRVFLTYADYIDISAKVVEKTSGKAVQKDKIIEIKSLAKKIRSKSDDLDKGIISEVIYIEDCLWLSLEAMIKLLAATIGKYACPEARKLIDGVTQYAFEYGRLALYQQEQALLDEILIYQGQLDEELNNKYDIYISELKEKSESFMLLINNAFDSDFSTQLRGSVALAKAAGVNEAEILDSIDKIDDSFVRKDNTAYF